MAVNVETTTAVPDGVEAVGVPVTSDGIVDSGLPQDFMAAEGFEAKPGQVLVIHVDGGPDLVAVGMGSAADLDLGVMRKAASALARSCSRRTRIASKLLEVFDGRDDRGRAASAHSEASSLASYSYTTFKSDPKPCKLTDISIVAPDADELGPLVDRGVRIADAVAFARDLVNEPGGSLTPRRLAEIAVEVAGREDLKVSVLDENDIVDAGLGGLLGVNRGSNEPPRFIQLCYEPESPQGSLALVGKGVTFDSGGLSIKSGESMMTMKDDMGGAAAVLGAFSAIQAVAPPCRVSAYIPVTDNMSGGDATRPGDVLRIRNGKTVEVLNTDAEGRLILADALSLASEDEPDAIVDIATLTGAVETALGNRVAGLMGNSKSWLAQVNEAADAVGERVWPLPLVSDYRKRLDSDVADLRNVARTRDGGSITAALFLSEFVAEGIPWAHLDIAGTAWWRDADDGEFTRGGTGFGVRTLLRLAEMFSVPVTTDVADDLI